MRNSFVKRSAHALIGCAVGASLAVPANFAFVSESRAEDAPRAIVGEARVAGKPMNFAVNLLGASPEDLDKAVKLADGLEYSKSLATYPEFGTFFVQSANPTFAQSLADALKEAGLSFDSIGPTRQAVVAGDEVVVDTPPAATGSRERRSAAVLYNQLDREGALEEIDPLTAAVSWGNYAVHSPETRAANLNTSKVVVGVLDTGVDGNHPDLKNKIDASLSAGCDHNGILDTSWDAWQDNHYHGTHVAGTIGAEHNGNGVEGVGPDSVVLAAVRTANADGMFYPEYVTCAFTWAGQNHFDLTNNSYYVDPWAAWVKDEPNQAAGREAVERAVNYSARNGVLNIAAAGNSALDLDNNTRDSESPNDLGEGNEISDRDITNGIDLPRQIPGVVAVSSVQKDRSTAAPDAGNATFTRSSFSNYGVNSISVAAPGSAIVSTFPGKQTTNNLNLAGYGAISGTSMASPHAAGVAAWIKAVHPNYTAAQVAEVLTLSADPSRLAEPADGKEYRGAGMVDALKAVTYPSIAPVIELDKQSVLASETVQSSLGGFMPGETITVSVVVGDYDQVVATAKADDEGKATVSWNPPAGIEPGSYEVVAAGLTSKRSAQVDLEITASKVDASTDTSDLPSADPVPGDIKQPESFVSSDVKQPESSAPAAKAETPKKPVSLPATGVGSEGLPVWVMIAALGAAALGARRR